MPLTRWPAAITNCSGDCGLAASAANVQQNLAFELKYPPDPAPYMHRRGASVAVPGELQALVEVARLDGKQRLANPSGRSVHLRPPELADWPFATVTLDRSWLFLQRNNSHRSASLAHPAPPLGIPGATIKQEHYGNFIVADAAPDETGRRATARMNSAIAGVPIASRPHRGDFDFLAEISPFQTLSEFRTAA